MKLDHPTLIRNGRRASSATAINLVHKKAAANATLAWWGHLD
jgi:hypothetical protein